MSKLTQELVEKAAKQIGISDEQRNDLIAMISDMTAESEGEEKPPAVKKQFVFLMSDNSGGIAACAAYTGWIVQIPESDSPHLAPQRIKDAADLFNCTKKGRLLPVQTVGESCENIPARIFREQQIWIKTKQPCYVISIANELPETPSILGTDRGSAKAGEL